MKAAIFRETGGSDTIEVVDLADPTPGPTEALLRVRACGLNRLDLYLRSGAQRTPVQLPHISGCEVAGEIVDFGGGAPAGLASGQRVVVAPYLFCGRCEYCLAGDETVCIRSDIFGMSRPGGFAELTVAPVANLIPIPAGVSDEAAAAVTLATLTAWHMLIGRAQVQPGEDVLVLAAGSGVGSAAIQIAKLAGARVIATASTDEKLGRAGALGADEIVNYATGDMVGEVRRLTGKRGVDIVVEHVGAATWERSLAVLGRNGRLVTCGATTGSEGKLNLWTLFAKQLQVIGAYGGTRAELRLVLQAVARGDLKPVIDTTYPLERLGEAQQRMEERGQFGKLIIVPSATSAA